MIVVVIDIFVIATTTITDSRGDRDTLAQDAMREMKRDGRSHHHRALRRCL
jgi:hypothetical protein